MRTLIGITATMAALALGGCGGHARNDRVHDDTPASYDALASDRTRDRDADVAASSTPPDAPVRDAYERFRADRRQRGELGTAGEMARAQGGTPPPPTAGPSATGFGGTSAGSEAAGEDRVPAIAAPSGAQVPTAPADQGPIPYSGSRTISPPYPMDLGTAPAGTTDDHGGTRLRTIVRPTSPTTNQWLGQPPGDTGPHRLDTAPSGGYTAPSGGYGR